MIVSNLQSHHLLRHSLVGLSKNTQAPHELLAIIDNQDMKYWANTIRTEDSSVEKSVRLLRKLSWQEGCLQMSTMAGQRTNIHSPKVT